MKSSFSCRMLVILTSFALCPFAVQAQGETFFYGSLSGLYSLPFDSSLADSEGGVTTELEMEMTKGSGLLFAIGVGADHGFRGEVEIGYRKADVDKVLDLREVSDLVSLSLMTNGIYVMGTGVLRSYIGVGVGFVKHDIAQFEQTEEGFAFPEQSENDIVVGYQGMAGFILPLKMAEIRFGYRYFATQDADFGGIDTSYGSHNFDAGLTFRF